MGNKLLLNMSLGFFILGVIFTMVPVGGQLAVAGASLTLTVNPTTVAPGGTQTYAVKLTAPSSPSLTDIILTFNYRLTGSATWTTIMTKTISTDASGNWQGTYTITVSATQTLGTYEVETVASKDLDSLTSNIVTVTVAGPQPTPSPTPTSTPTISPTPTPLPPPYFPPELIVITAIVATGLIMLTARRRRLKHPIA
jgi:hypothetical protein